MTFASRYKRRIRLGGALCIAAVALAAAPKVAASVSGSTSNGYPSSCSAGAHSLGPAGSRVYPDTGNGGYKSVHTDVYLAYSATTNRFLAGNHVVLTDLATQCLTSFSLDLERTSANTTDGPNLSVQSVTVNGKGAKFEFVEPTYPGDPLGWDDPNPEAHEISQLDPVGGPHHNPLPPACSPELHSTKASTQYSEDGEQCPADKLMITPHSSISRSSTFTVVVSYTGRPGVHNDGDGTTEGWFRSSDGGFVTTEPVGSEDWIPLNNYPSAKPTYDFYDTVAKGLTAVSNGVLESVRDNKPTGQFPKGSETFHWYSQAPIANYLVEASVGRFSLTERTADNGVKYYEAQDLSIPPAQRKRNLAIMQQQQGITEFESQINGTYPFTSDGIIVGTPPASFEEEMQTMITFAGGQIGLSVLYHENMHQWWGDNVTESNYRYTFYKEGMAELAQAMFAASKAEAKDGGPYSRAGEAAYEASLTKVFDTVYDTATPSFWKNAPSDPTPYLLFSGDSTYERPMMTYIALRQILGPTNFTEALHQIQGQYGGADIDEAQLEAVYLQWLPVKSTACSAELSEFFLQWFDTAYPSNGQMKPTITGPGLGGAGFYKADGTCSS